METEYKQYSVFTSVLAETEYTPSRPTITPHPRATTYYLSLGGQKANGLVRGRTKSGSCGSNLYNPRRHCFWQDENKNSISRDFTHALLLLVVATCVKRHNNLPTIKCTSHRIKYACLHIRQLGGLNDNLKKIHKTKDALLFRRLPLFSCAPCSHKVKVSHARVASLFDC